MRSRPYGHTQQLEEKLTSPLSTKKTNIPLPQQVNIRCSKILPVNKEFKDTRGKPPVYNTRHNNTRCQINYDNVLWEGNDTSYLHLPNSRQQTVLEQFSMNDTTDIRLCHRCGGGGISESTAMQTFIVTFASPTLTIHQYVDHTQIL